MPFETYESTLLSSYFVIISWTQLQAQMFVILCISLQISCFSTHSISLASALTLKMQKSNAKQSEREKKKKKRTRRQIAKNMEQAQKVIMHMNIFVSHDILHHVWISLFASFFHTMVPFAKLHWETCTKKDACASQKAMRKMWTTEYNAMQLFLEACHMVFISIKSAPRMFCHGKRQT